MKKLIIVTGLQGSGKSTTAKKLSDLLDAVLLRSDVIRKELFEVRHYTQKETDIVFNTMFERARSNLIENKNVVLDAVFAKKSERDFIQEISDECKAQFILIEIVCDESEIKKRIEQRIGDASEGDFEDYLKFKKIFEPIEEKHTVIDNSSILEDIDMQLGKIIELRD